MNILYRAPSAWAVFTACLASTVLAQEPTSTVTGSVVDSSNQPIRGVLVFMDEGPGSDTTGAVGAFRLEGITPGTHMLNVRKDGRRHHYSVDLDGPFKHPVLKGFSLRIVLDDLIKQASREPEVTGPTA